MIANAPFRRIRVVREQEEVHRGREAGSREDKNEHGREDEDGSEATSERGDGD